MGITFYLHSIRLRSLGMLCCTRSSPHSWSRAAAFGRDIRIDFSPDFGGREPLIDINRAVPTRIISNLLRNSVEACIQIGAKDISAWVCPEDRYVAINVVDNGCGIVSDNQSHIFDSGFSTKGEGRGRG